MADVGHSRLELREHVVAERCLDAFDLTKPAREDQLADLAVGGSEARLHALHEKDALAPRDGRKTSGLVLIEGEGLLAEDGLAGQQGTFDPLGVQAMRKGNVDGIDGRVLEHGLVGAPLAVDIPKGVVGRDPELGREGGGLLLRATADGDKGAAPLMREACRKAVGDATRGENAPVDHVRPPDSRDVMTPDVGPTPQEEAHLHASVIPNSATPAGWHRGFGRRSCPRRRRWSYRWRRCR